MTSDLLRVLFIDSDAMWYQPYELDGLNWICVTT
jgi:hypothetical protein